MLPFEGDAVAAGVKEQSLRFRTQVLTKQGVRDGSVPGGAGLIAKTSGTTCVTAIKKHETRDTLVVRLYNMTGGTTSEAFRFGMDVSAAWSTDLLENRLSELALAGPRELKLELGPHEIATVEVEFA